MADPEGIRGETKLFHFYGIFRKNEMESKEKRTPSPLYTYSTKKLRKSQKSMEQTNTKANNLSIFIYLLRYISSAVKDASFSVLALIPLL